MNGSRTVALAAALWLALVPPFGPADPAWAADKPDKKLQPEKLDKKPKVARDTILVGFVDGTPEPVKQDLLKKKGAALEDEIPELDVKVVKVPRGKTPEQLVAEYAQEPGVEYAELNGLAYALGSAAPSDPFYTSGEQWALYNDGQFEPAGTPDADIDAPEAWATTTGSSAVPIAILDTGLRKDHPEFRDKVIRERNFTSSPSGADDRHGHGTHVAASAAALTDGAGMAGVCQDCKLMNGKVLGDDGGGQYSWIASGVTWATDNGAKVINMSLGGTYNSLTLKRAVERAWNKGVVLTCAAGNDGVSTIFYPAGYTNCIAVAAIDHRNGKASWSNYGSSWVDVAAPGVDILSALPFDNSANSSASGYAYWSGTSMASPHVAGVVGLIRSASPTLGASSVRTRLESRIDPIAGTGSYWSKGRVNACKAVKNTTSESACPQPSGAVAGT